MKLRYIFLPIACLIWGCGHYLDKLSSSTLTIPATLADCEALLNDYTRMNANYPSDGEASADDYFLPVAGWEALTVTERSIHTWQADAYPDFRQWLNPYQVIYNANLVLETLGKLPPDAEETDRHDAAKGAALFFRAYAYYGLAQLFAPAYRLDGDNGLPSLPLRLGPDLDAPAPQVSVETLYRQILDDLTSASLLLPPTRMLPTLPTVSASHAMLARVLLTMGRYPEAAVSATEALAGHDGLLDFTAIDPSADPSFHRFNAEVIFHSTIQYNGQLSPYAAVVPPGLFAEYTENDLRGNLYFTTGWDGSVVFRGNYDGVFGSTLFNGLTTAELYLIRAECRIRVGETDAALEDLHTLLTRRITGYTTPVGLDRDGALGLVLRERRKELVFRGLRWPDLRRLNQHPATAVTLERILGDDRHTLPPGDPRYTLLPPLEVIQTSPYLKITR